jgi:hypothetical protein
VLELVVAEEDRASRHTLWRLISAKCDFSLHQKQKNSRQSKYRVESSSSLLASRVEFGAVARRRMVSVDAISTKMLHCQSNFQARSRSIGNMAKSATWQIV